MLALALRPEIGAIHEVFHGTFGLGAVLLIGGGEERAESGRSGYRRPHRAGAWCQLEKSVLYTACVGDTKAGGLEMVTRSSCEVGQEKRRVGGERVRLNQAGRAHEAHEARHAPRVPALSDEAWLTSPGFVRARERRCRSALEAGVRPDRT